MIPAEYYLVLAALMFFIGVFGFLTRRNLLAVLADKYWQQRRRCGYLEKTSLRARIAARLLFESKQQKSELFSGGIDENIHHHKGRIF